MENFKNQIKKLVTKGAIIASAVLPMKEGLKAQEKINTKTEIENYLKNQSEEAKKIIATFKSDSIHNEHGNFLSPKSDTIETNDRTLYLERMNTSEGIYPGFSLKEKRKDGYTYQFHQKAGVAIRLRKEKSRHDFEQYTVEHYEVLEDFINGKTKEFGSMKIKKYVEHPEGGDIGSELEGKNAIEAMKSMNNIFLEDLKIIQEYQKTH